MQNTLLRVPTAITMQQIKSNSTSVNSSNIFVVAVETHEDSVLVCKKTVETSVFSVLSVRFFCKMMSLISGHSLFKYLPCWKQTVDFY